jgi:hypothetical protein
MSKASYRIEAEKKGKAKSTESGLEIKKGGLR